MRYGNFDYIILDIVDRNNHQTIVNENTIRDYKI